MKSGEEKISLMLTRSEIIAIVATFEGYAGERGYGGSVEEVKRFYGEPSRHVYERMVCTLNLMDMLDMMEEDDGN